jgi:hypothetical protein
MSIKALQQTATALLVSGGSQLTGAAAAAELGRSPLKPEAAEGAPMADIAGLQRLRDERFFACWDKFVSPERVAASEASVRSLIDHLIALGPELSEEAARRAVEGCVRRFNDLDDGWIVTLEREDIFEQVGRVIDLCGFGYDEDWIGAREW